MSADDYDNLTMPASNFNCTPEELPSVLNRTEWSLVCNQTLPEHQCRPQEYYSANYSLIGTLFQSIIFVIGVLGNILVCTVVIKTRSMRTTTNCYLVSLAVADTITLVSSVPQEVLSYHILGDQWVWGSVGCTLMIYLQYLGIDASALSLTAFTMERYIAICHPIKSKSICTLSRAKKIIVTCWIFAIIYCSPWFFLTTLRKTCVQGIGEVATCGFRLRRDSTSYLVMFFTDIMLFYCFPLLISVVLYTLIGKMLLSKSKNKLPGGGTRNSLSAAAAHKSNQSRVQVVKMLACVVFIFATLWVPYRGLLVYNSFATMNKQHPYLDLWYLMFAKTCVYMNCAINPILYNAMSDKFRKAFRLLLVCGRFNPARRSPAAAAMAATMATDMRSDGATNSVRNNPHAINQSRNLRSCSSPRSASNSITAFAMVEIPPSSDRKPSSTPSNDASILLDSSTTPSPPEKMDRLPLPTSHSETCQRHRHIKRCGSAGVSKKDAATEMGESTLGSLKAHHRRNRKHDFENSAAIVKDSKRTSTAV